MRIEEKPWDSEVTGWRCGNVTGFHIRDFESHELSDYDLVWAQPAADRIEIIQILEDVGFRLADVRIHGERNLARFPSRPGIVTHPYRRAIERDAVVVGEFAAGLFKYGRFHADPRIPRAIADKYKRAWGEGACSGYADCAYLMGNGHVQFGFVAMRGNVLYFIGVREDCRGIGIGKALVELACGWIESQGESKIHTITQGGNLPALALYRSCGFETTAAGISLHWVNPKRWR